MNGELHKVQTRDHLESFVKKRLVNSTFGKTANKSCLFSSVLCPQKWVKVYSVSRIDSEWNSEVFSLPKMFRNRIRRFFLFQKWFGKEFRGLSYPKMVQNGILRVFIFQEMGWNRIPRFFSSAKQVEFLREPSPVPSCSIFHIVIVSMENGNPSCSVKNSFWFRGVS